MWLVWQLNVRVLDMRKKIENNETKGGKQRKEKKQNHTVDAMRNSFTRQGTRICIYFIPGPTHRRNIVCMREAHISRALACVIWTNGGPHSPSCKGIPHIYGWMDPKNETQNIFIHSTFHTHTEDRHCTERSKEKKKKTRQPTKTNARKTNRRALLYEYNKQGMRRHARQHDYQCSLACCMWWIKN